MLLASTVRTHKHKVRITKKFNRLNKAGQYIYLVCETMQTLHCWARYKMKCIYIERLWS